MTDGPLHDQRTETQHGPLLLQADFDAEQVADVRRALTERLLAAGLAGDRLDDFVTAINEAMTNAVRHGGGRGELRIWQQRHLVCEIRDRGRGFADPLPTIPSDRPQPSANGGLGLWLARELADSVEIHSGADGVRIRLTMAVTDPAGPPQTQGDAPPTQGLAEAPGAQGREDAAPAPGLTDTPPVAGVDGVAGSGGAGPTRIDRTG